LPGLILEVDINKGQQTFKALSIDPKADIASIKEPTGKKRYTAAEFNKERDKMMSDMQQNGGGPGRVMRFGN
jgi:GLPGLI family protein